MVNIKYINSLARFVGVVFFACFSLPLVAGPDGGEVVGGAGTISREGTTTTINQATDRMAIDWQSYNVNANERVHYIQPDSSSISLNRILSASASNISGRIDANGQVFLVNPNGVFFGKDSVINAGGILASGLSIDPDDFMNGEFIFSSIGGTEGLVVNGGLLNAATGGYVNLLGQQIQNDGVISAQLGSVNLAAGREAILTFDDGGFLGVQITESILQDEIGVDAAIVNNGEITAEDGQILISAAASQTVFTQAVNSGELRQARSVVVDDDGSFILSAGANVKNTGSISASGDSGGDVVVLGENVTSSGNISADSHASEQGGAIEIHSVVTTELTENSETSANASNGVGGEIKIFGKNVGLLGDSIVEANGANGGGTVLVGGDKTGSNPLVRNSDFIFLGENSSVSVDGLVDGDGGKLITFASNTARIYGELNARGGEFSGFGGFVETSGLFGFEISTSPIVDAVDGGGEWLIDPYDVTIVDGSSETFVTGDGTELTRDYSPFFSGASIGWNILEDYLDGRSGCCAGGRTVTITTGTTGGDDGDITFNMSTDAILTEGGRTVDATLVLNAARDIVINDQNISVANSEDQLNLQLIAGRNIEVTGASTISTDGGDFYAESTNFTLGADGSNSASISTGGGDFEIYASGTVNIYDAVTTSGGAFIVGGDHDNDGDTADIIPTSFVSDYASDFGIVRTFSSDGGGDITIQTSGNAILGQFIWGDTDNAIATPSNFSVTAGGDVFVNQEVDFYLTGDSDFSLAADGGITVSASINASTFDNVDTLDVILAANTDMADGGDVIIDADIYTGGGDFTASGDLFNSEGFLVDTENVSSGNDSTSSNGGDVDLDFTVTATLGNFITDDDGTGNFDVTAAGIVDGSSSETLTIVGESILTAGAGNDITLDNDHDFQGNVRIVSGNNVTLNDAGGNGMSVGSTDVSTISGNLVVTSDGGITDGGQLVNTAGTSSFTSYGNVVLFDVATHDFSGGINVDTSGENASDNGNDITLDGANLNIETLDASGNDTGTTNAGDIVINVSGIFDDDATSTITAQGYNGGTDGDLTISGDATGNTIYLDNTSWSYNTLSINGNDGDDTFNIYTSFTETIFGGAGDDTFAVQNPDLVLTVDGGAETAGDALRSWDGDSTQDAGLQRVAYWTVTGAGVSIDDADPTSGQFITLTSIETLQGGDEVLRDGETDVFVGGVDNFDIQNAFSGTINGGSAADIFNIDNDVTTINGEDGADTFYLDTNTINATTINGGEEGPDVSTDTIYGFDDAAASNAWAITGLEAGTVESDSNGNVVNFNEIESIFGSDQDGDTFTLNSEFSGAIDARGGSDTVNVTQAGEYTIGFSGTFNGIQNIDAINNTLGDSTGFTLTLAADANDADADRNEWAITTSSDTTNTGTVVEYDGVTALTTVTFSNFASLNGNALPDIFDVSGTGNLNAIDGGEGADTFNLQSAISLSVIGGEEVSDTSTDILNAPDAVAFWNSSADEAGTIVDDEDTPTWTITFSEFETLQGNDQADTFTLGHSFGQVSGGEGADIFNVSAGIDLNLSGGEEGTDASNDILNGPDLLAFWNSSVDEAGTIVDDEDTPTWTITFDEFETLQGNNQADTFTLGHSFAQVSGGEGADIFNVSVGIDLSLSGGEEGADTSNDILNGPDLLAFWNSSADEAGTIVDDEDTPTWTITFDEFETLQGNDQSDTFTLGHSFAQVSGGEGADTFNVSVGIDLSLSGGEEGADTSNDVLNGPDLIAFWNSSADEAGSIVDDEDAPTWTITFDEFETLQGNDQSDTFTLGHSFAQVSGGEGVDTFNVSVGIDLSVSGGEEGTDTSNDVLNGPDLIAFWNSSADEAGTIVDDEDTPTWTITFDEFETLQGNDQSDTFTLGHSFAQVSGGEGADTFNVSVGIDLSLSGGEEGADTSNDILNGPDLLAFWNSSADEAGTIVDDEDTPTWTITFDEFETLQGNDQVDTFTLSHNFTNVFGGANTDVFTISSAMSVTQMNGNAGNDTFNFDGDLTGNVFGGQDADSFNVNVAQTATNISGDLGDDTINLQASVTGTITGGAGADNLNVLAAGVSATFNAGESGNDPDDETDTITGFNDPDRENDWLITGAEAGQLTNNSATISFTEIESILGSNADRGVDNSDTFSINTGVTFTGTIDAQDGRDVYEVSTAGTYTVGFTGSFGGVSDIEVISNSSGSVSNFVLALGDGANDPDADRNDWAITTTGANENSGTIEEIDEDAGDAVLNTISFENFESFEGNDIADVFAVSGTDDISNVDGGSDSNNSFSYAVGTDNTWTITGQHQGNIDNTITFTNIQTITGSSNDNLTARDQANTWVIDTLNTVEQDIASPTDAITFAGMDTLNGNSNIDTFSFESDFSGTVNGGANGDQFNINTAVSGTLNGGDDNDTFTIADAGSVTSVIDGEGGSDTIVGRTTGNTWTIDEANGGSVSFITDFSSIENLNTSGGDDTINYTVSASSLDRVVGGDGDDILNISGANVTTTITVDDNETLASGQHRTTDVENIYASNAVANTLALESAASDDYRWDITDFDGDGGATADGINDGQLHLLDTDDNPVTTINFVNFESLQGGDGDDSFVIDTDVDATPELWGITNTINGGDGIDEIIGRNAATAWVVNNSGGDAVGTYVNGIATDDGNTSYLNVEALRGGDAADSFAVNDVDVAIILDGGDATDTVTLPSGQDVDITIGEDVGSLSFVNIEEIESLGSGVSSVTFASDTDVANRYVEWNITGDGEGTVGYVVNSVAQATTSFINFQSLFGGAEDDTFIFDTAGSVEAVSGVADGGSIQDDEDNTIIGRVAGSQFTVNADEQGVIADSSAVTYLNEFTYINALEGSATNVDTFTITSSGQFNGSVDGGGTNGDGITDTLTVQSVGGNTNEWEIDGAITDTDSHTVRRSLDTADEETTFTNIESLTGGSGADWFTFLTTDNTEFDGTIDAAGGSTDVINVAGLPDASGDYRAVYSGSQVLLNEEVAGTLYTVLNVEQVTGDNASNLTFVSSSGTNNWDIEDFDGGSSGTNAADGANDGQINNSFSFVDFANLEGNAQNDTFIIQSSGSFNGSLDAIGTSGNSLEWTAGGNTWTLDDATAFAGTVDAVNFSNIQTITGSGDTLIGRTQNNTWQITDADDGTVVSTDLGGDQITFVGMANIQGNTLTDNFTIVDGGSISGTITGTRLSGTDNANDSLLFESNASDAVAWTLDAADTGDVEGNDFQRIEILQGGNGDDTFDVSDSTSTADVRGNSGTDTISLSHVSASSWTLDSNDGGSVETVIFDFIEMIEGNDAIDTVQVDADFAGNVSLFGGDDDVTLDANINGTFNTGDGADDIYIHATGLTTTVNGGGGAGENDTIEITHTAASIWTINGSSNSVDGVGFLNIEVIVGNDEMDTVTLTSSFNDIQTNGGEDLIHLSDDVDSLNTGDDNDTININVDNISVGLNGGGTGDNDILNIAHTNASGWLFDATNSVDNVTFSNIETLQGNDAVDTVVVNADFTGSLSTFGGNDDITLSANFTSLDLGDGSDDVDIAVDNLSADIVGGDSDDTGTDVITITHAGASIWTLNTSSSVDSVTFSQIETINGNGAIDTVTVDGDFGTINTNGGLDVVNLNANVSVLNTGADDDTIYVNTSTIVTTIDGGGDSSVGDELIGPARGASEENDWRITSDNAGTLNTDVVFSNIENVSGNDGDDAFTFSNGASVANVRGLSALLGVDAGADTLTVDDSGTTIWGITDVGGGNVDLGSENFDFYGIENLVGGEDVDQFNFTTASAAVTGYVDGGDPSSGTGEETDVLTFSAAAIASGEGLVVELMTQTDQVTSGIPIDPDVVDGVSSFAAYDNVHVLNIESIIAPNSSAPDADEVEARNWLVLNHDDDVEWVFSSTINNGSVERIVDDAANPVEVIDYSLIDFENFGSMQAGTGDALNIPNEGIDISGVYILGSGRFSRNFANVVGLVVVDIDPRLSGITGNGNTLLRAVAEADGGEANFNIDNDWLIDGENSGSFTATWGAGVDETYELTFSGVNLLQGGTGDDTFSFSGIGDLIDGSIHGGIGGTDGIDASASTIDMNFAMTELMAAPTAVVESFPSGITSATLVVNSTGVIDLYQVSTLLGSTSADLTTLISGNTDENYRWDISATNAVVTHVDTGASLTFLDGTVATGNVDRIIGGAANDTFNISDLNVFDDDYSGGDGTDILNLTSIASAVNVSLDDDIGGTVDVYAQGIEDINLAAFENRLWGGDAGATWTMTGINSGSVVYSDDAFAGTQTTTIDNVSHVIAGSGNDDFIFDGAGIINGTIDGGSGTDTLNGNTSSQSLTVQISDVFGSVLDTGTTVVDVFSFEDISANGSLNNTLRAGSISNNSWLIDGTDAGDLNGMTFSGFANLTGSSVTDTFTLDGNDAITGVIDGGLGVGVNDRVNLTGVIRDVVVAVSDVASTDISIVNVEQVDARAGSEVLLIADNEINEWTIDGSNSGNVLGASYENALVFTNFANLQGGTLRDNFEFDINGQITGQIDGAAPAAGTPTQIDTVDLSAIINDVVISLNAAVDGDVDLVNIEEIISNNAANNSLYADDIENNWSIDGENAGDLLNSNIAFSGFANLFGGSGNDVFTFEGDGAISGVVDGGDQAAVDGADEVDMSRLTSVEVVVGDVTNGFVNIESYTGNNSDSLITAANLINTWTLDSGENNGRIEDQLGNTVSFEGFNNLQGGELNDDFILNGGSVSGTINGGLGTGNDDLIVTIVSGVSGQVEFIGGDGTDTVTTSGGSPGYIVDYSVDPSGSAALEYNSQDAGTPAIYNVEYSEVETVTDNVIADTLTINDLQANTDTISLDNGQFTLNVFEQVNYDNKESISVLAETADTILIDGPITLTGTIALENASVVSNAADAELQAQEVIFNGNQSVGASDSRIALNADRLAIQNVIGEVYLNEANSVSITGFSNNSSLVDLVANGTITDRVALSGSSPIYFTSVNGDILLDENNSFTNQVNLSAVGDIEFTNTSTTTFGNVNAQNLTVVASGNVTDQAEILVSANAAFSMNGNNLILDGASNDLTNVNVQNANTVTLVDIDSIAVQGSASTDFAVTASGVIDVVAALSADDVTLQSNTGSISVNGNIEADNAIALTAEGINVAASLRVDNNNSLVPAVNINAGGGALTISGDINTSNASASAGDITLFANSIDQQIGADITGGDITITSSTFINQFSDILAEGNVITDAQNGDLFMDSDTVTQGFEVALTANGDVTIETVIAEIFTVNGVNVFQVGDVTSNSMIDYSADSLVQIASTSNVAASSGNVDISADVIEIGGSVRADNGDVLGVSLSDTLVEGSITAQTISINTGGAVAMSSAALLDAETEIVLAAENDLAVSTLQTSADDGRISLVSNSGGLEDNNGDSLNLMTDILEINTETNIGTSSDAIETQIGELDALNNGVQASDVVNISNNGDLNVNTLRSNTDITLSNLGTVLLVNSSDASYNYDRGEPDARLAGGVMNANYNSGILNIFVDGGDLLAANPPSVNRNRPELVGEFVNVSVDGNFGGSNGRPIVVYAREQMSISRASGGIFPIWGFNTAPNLGLVTDADLVDPSAIGNVSDLLIDVESVDEIDPAVFTEVRNYSYDNISIRMPRDQLYDDEDEEEDEFAL